MSRFSRINLSKLPAPSVIEEVDYETIVARMVERYVEAKPDEAEFIALESDPIRKIFEDAAYEIALNRSRYNQSAKAVMLAFSNDTDLDHLAALVPLERLEGESDDAFRDRIQLAPEGFSVAGPEGGYEFHAGSAHPDVRDVYIDTYTEGDPREDAPQPGDVHVYVLASNDGTLSDEIKAVIEASVSDEDVRPLTDFVTVKPADIVGYNIEAVLTVADGPSDAAVTEAAHAAAQKFVDDRLVFGGINGLVTHNSILAALHVDGVIEVELIEPAQDFTLKPYEVAICAEIDISLGGS